jgi:ribosome-binding factor A
MAREFERSSRLGERIRRVLADLIRRELDDPRLGLVSLTDVELSRDVAHARVYFSLLGGPEEVGAVQATLTRAAGRLRSGLAKALVSRTVPSLEFVFDDSLAAGARMDELIASARARDEEAQRGGGGREEGGAG